MRKHLYIFLPSIITLAFVLMINGCGYIGEPLSTPIPTEIENSVDPVETETPNSTETEVTMESEEPMSPKPTEIESTTEPEKPQEPDPSETENTTEPSEPATQEPTEEILTPEDAQILLNKYFVGRYKTSYLPANNRQDEDTLYYRFSIEITYISAPIENTVAYAWVNSVTGELEFEERYFYANVPDSMMPIPMRNGVVVPYDYYTPPNHAWCGGYHFLNMSMLDVYKEQLREAGFFDRGQVMSIDSMWSYNRKEDKIHLDVELRYRENGFVISMNVSDLTDW